MTYDEAIAYWYGRIDYERRAIRPGDLKLDRMRSLLARLGDPHDALRVAHVAGSKGKGSVAAMLAAVLRAAGYRVGLFTSPHLSAVEERIQVDGVPVSRDELAALVADVVPAADAMARQGGGPTFFEVGTALGFLHFRRRRCDVAVVEVGLGGRFDSTNVVSRPAVTVITSVSYDHTDVLGTELGQIAFEKAGIVKPGRPCVSGATAPEAAAVVARVCAERGAPLWLLGRDVSFTHEPGRLANEPGRPWVRRPRVTVTTDRAWPAMDLGLLGAHQAANAAVAVAAVERLREAGMHLPDAAVAAGLAGVRWPARMEVVGTRPLVLLDCAHNGASARAVAEALAESAPPGRPRVLVFAASADKDVPAILAELAPHFDRAVLTRYTTNPRWVPPERLAGLWAEAKAGPAEVEPAPAAALARATALAGEGGLVCVTGSVFLAGELRPLLVRDGR